MRRAGPAIAALLLLAASRTTSGAEPARLRFAVSYPEALAKGPLDGRLLLLLSTDASAEPRFQISDTDVAKSQQVFGIDVLGWKPGEAKVFDASVLGYPAEALGDVKAGALPRAGAAPQVRDVPPRRRPRGEAADGPRRGPAVEPRARQPAQHAARGGRRSRARRDGERSRSTRRSPRSRRRPTRSTSSTSRIQSERLSKFWGRADAPGRRACCCPRASTSTRRPASRSSSSTATSRTRWTTSARSRRTRTSSPSTPSASTSTATTGSSRSSATSSTRTGPRPTSRASWSSRSSTRTRTTTTPTR